MKRFFAPLISAIVFLAPISTTAGIVRVRVEISGVSGPVAENVQALLSLNRVTGKRGADENEVRRLYNSAEQEILTALRPFGFYRARVNANLHDTGTRWKVEFRIEPGAPVPVDTVDIRVTGSGAASGPFVAAAGEFPLRSGDPLHHSAYESGKARFVNVAADSGFLDARFDTAAVLLDLVRYKANVVVHFDTGERYRFGAVTFHQAVVDDEVLRGFIGFEPGDPFRTTQLMELQNRLNNTGYFRRIEVRPRRDLATDGMIPIEIDFDTQSPQRYEIGAGYGTDTGPRLSLEFQLRRLNRRGHSAAINARVAQIENSILARYQIPSIYPSTWVTIFNIGFVRQAPTSSESNRYIAAVNLGHQRGRLMETFGINYEVEQFTVGADEGTSRLLIPSVDWSGLRTDNLIFTHRGGRVQLALSGARETLLSTLTFTQIRFTGKGIRTVRDGTRVISRFEAGRTWADRFQEVPASIRFFAGGDQSVRGYEYKSLGPTDQSGVVVGGNSLFVWSVELDHYPMRKWGAAAFFDAGNAFDSDRREAMKRGFGVGLRWISPVGLIRVDHAWAVNDNYRGRWHFVIGPDL